MSAAAHTITDLARDDRRAFIILFCEDDDRLRTPTQSKSSTIMLLSIVVNIITYRLNSIPLERRNVGDVLCMIICCARDAVDMIEGMGAEGGSHHGHGVELVVAMVLILLAIVQLVDRISYRRKDE